LGKNDEGELFKWFLASILFGARISETIAKNTELVGELHNRMPVILNRDAYNFTLDTGTHKAEEFRDLFKPYPSRAMEAYQVSTRVNKPGYDSPGLNKPIPVED
jgi:putative SOS response-associated peptidase YedK